MRRFLSELRRIYWARSQHLKLLGSSAVLVVFIVVLFSAFSMQNSSVHLGQLSSADFLSSEILDFGDESVRHGLMKPFRFHVYPSDPEFTSDLADKFPEFFNLTSPMKTYLVEWYVGILLRHHPAHTDDPEEAVVFIVPTMESFWRFARLRKILPDSVNEEQIWKQTLNKIKSMPYWRRFNGHDHYAMNNWYRDMNEQIPNINFFTFGIKTQGNPPGGVRWEFHDHFRRLSKHVTVPHFTTRTKQKPFIVHDRQIFLLFIGARSTNSPKNTRVRQMLQQQMDAANRSDVQFMTFQHSRDQIEHEGIPLEDYMANATFCPHVPTDSDIAARVYASILNGCIPVMFCDWCIYAWENYVDYAQIAYFFSEGSLETKFNLVSTLSEITEEEIREKQRNLQNVQHYFEYHEDPSDGALHAVVRQLEVQHRDRRRYVRWMRNRFEHPELDNRTGYGEHFNDF